MIVLLIGLILFCVLDFFDDHSRTYHRASTISRNTGSSKGKSKLIMLVFLCLVTLSNSHFNRVGPYWERIRRIGAHLGNKKGAIRTH